MDINKTACFIGHRKINETDELKEKIYNVVEDLIIKKVLLLSFLAVKASLMTCVTR